MDHPHAPGAWRPPERFNLADHLLEARVREGRGERVALRTDRGSLTYAEVNELAGRFGAVLRAAGVEPEQRVMIALPDGPHFVGALFGTIRIGAVAVMVNPHLRSAAIGQLYDYTRAKVALVHRETLDTFERALAEAMHRPELIAAGSAPGEGGGVGGGEGAGEDGGDLERRLAATLPDPDIFPSHRDDPAIWLFSGGTTGRPKAVVQTHAAFANSTECYAGGVIGYAERDITISVPKLFFGYATGSNLFFPFSAGASAVLFGDRCTPEAIFERIERHRPTILVNVPTMVQQMVNAPGARTRDLSSLRLATSAGEALPVELHERWREMFGVELLDGLGTAEMWHIFISNRPGAVRPGTLGTVVPGFDVRVRDEEGRDLPDGETGTLWVRGDSLALGYWQRRRATMSAFRGEWYVSGDMIRRDADGFIVYGGRADDMLKVAGKWLSPQEVENCLVEHPSVLEAAVVGVVEADGLVRPHAYVVASGGRRGTEPDGALEEELQAHVRRRLESFKSPRTITLLDALPRTHLGKVDRGGLRRLRTPD